MCLSDCHAKKIPTPAEKQVLQKAGLGLKKIKFSVEDDEVAVYNQLTGPVESDETVNLRTVGISYYCNVSPTAKS